MAARILALALCAACAMGDSQGEVESSDAGAPPGAEAQAWLDAHNQVRQSADLNPPPPSPLPQLTWSADAAVVARAYADNCVYQHNQNRGFRGENIAANTPPSSWKLQDVVGAWAGEARFYDYASNTCAAGVDCGHYTQIVWRDTTRVGCAHRTCFINTPLRDDNNNPLNGGAWEFWVCDYEPPGNWVGQKPY